MSSEQKYLYWCPGMEQPDDLAGWEIQAGIDKYERRIDSSDGTRLLFAMCYRKPITDAEYRAHHAAEIDSTFESDAERRTFYGMRMWPCDCPKGYRVVDFRKPTIDDNLVLTQYGDFVLGSYYSILVVCPILEKIKPVREPITADTVMTDDMEYWNVDFWISVRGFSGRKVKDATVLGCVLKLRYADDPDSEFTYTPPIEWVTPTDEDARYRPSVETRDSQDGEWKTGLILLAVTHINGNTPFRCTANTITIESHKFCRVDKRLLKGLE